MTIVRSLMLLSLVVWIGGIAFFAFVLAPTVFAVLPTRHLAGQVVSRSLGTLHWIAIVSAVVFLLTSTLDALNTPGVRHGIARNVLVTIMLLLTLASHFGVAKRMEGLRAGMGEIDAVAATDARRVAFNRLHRVSTALEGTVLLLGLATVVLIARE